ncbi:MAG: hypothetical protein WCK02_13655, partial [Bacteroidota bacterium]
MENNKFDKKNMSTEIIYKNYSGEILTTQQLQLIDNYFKEFYEDGILRKSERYYDFKGNKRMKCCLYLLPGEDKSVAIAELASQYGGGGIIFNKQQMGDFIQDDFEAYKGTQLIQKKISVFDNQGRYQAVKRFNVETGEIIEVKKYHYLDLGEDYDEVWRRGELTFIYRLDDPGAIFFTAALAGFEGGYEVDEDGNDLNKLGIPFTHLILFRFYY